MAAYTDYAYYTGTYLGKAIALADFPRLALRASAVIDQITFGRTAAIVTAATDTATIAKIKMATCAVAEEFQIIDKREGGGEIQTEKVGNYQVSYAARPAGSDTKKLSDAAKLYLWDTDLMYAGLAEGE